MLKGGLWRMKQNPECKYPQCDGCKIRLYNPGPNFHEDLRINAYKGCFLAMATISHMEENADEY